MTIERRESKRGPRYLARIYINGKRIAKTFSSQREAKRWLAQQQLERGPRSAEKCGPFAERWPDTHPRKRESTNVQNRYALRPFIAEFGNKRLSDIDRVAARAFALQHRRAAVVARAMFNDSINDGLVSTNPFSNLRMEQSRGRRDLEVISEEKLHELADAALSVHGPEYGPPMRAMVIFAGYVGLRLGEHLVLEWGDVDLGSSEVRISRSLSKQGRVTAPKNGSARTVVLPSPAREALLSYPRRASEPRVFLSKRWQPFKNATAHYAIWNPVRAAAGLSDLDWHSLRHFAATHLLELGASAADVAVQLGHTDGGALVLSTYGHPSEDAARERLKRLSEPLAPVRKITEAREAG